MAAMLVALTKKANENSFVEYLQHDGEVSNEVSELFIQVYGYPRTIGNIVPPPPHNTERE